MDKKSANIAGFMSDAAKKFMAEYQTSETPILTPENLPQIRKDGYAYYAERAERAITRWNVRHQQIEMAGITCLEVLPQCAEPSMTVLYCFGGGFISGSAYEDMTLTAPLAALMNARVIAPEYRLAPEHPYPAAIDDCYMVYQQLASTGPFVLVGESAGGNLALVLMLRAKRDGLNMPMRVSLMSPSTSRKMEGDSNFANDGRDPTIGKKYGDQIGKLYAPDQSLSNPEVSPMYGEYDPSFPPIMITTGTRDFLLSQSVQMSRTLKHAGIDVDLQVWDGMWHVFECYDELPEAEESLRIQAEFLKST